MRRKKKSFACFCFPKFGILSEGGIKASHTKTNSYPFEAFFVKPRRLRRDKSQFLYAKLLSLLRLGYQTQDKSQFLYAKLLSLERTKKSILSFCKKAYSMLLKDFWSFQEIKAWHTKQKITTVFYAKKGYRLRRLCRKKETSTYLFLVCIRKTKKRYVLVSFFLHNFRRKDTSILCFLYPMRSHYLLLRILLAQP